MLVALELEIIFQNFCSTSGVPFAMIEIFYSLKNGPLEPYQYKLQQMATFRLSR